MAGLVTVGAYGIGELVPGLSSLVWALVLGAFVATVFKLPGRVDGGIRFAAKPVLKFGVVLLGFQISLAQAISLGPRVILVVVLTLPVTFGAAVLLGRWLGLSAKLSLLIGTGSAICGASAIAAMNGVVEAKEEDVGFAVATVTLFGTIAVFAIPAFAVGVVGLPPEAAGVWAGASVHEVGQVVAAAAPLGNGALETATLVKLTRVALLAPSILIVGWLLRSRNSSADGGSLQVVPLFVLGFLVALVVRSSGVLPQEIIEAIISLGVLLLTLALSGLGLNLSIRNMIGLGWRPLGLGFTVSVIVAATSLALVTGLGI